jgi:hypothetical protein
MSKKSSTVSSRTSSRTSGRTSNITSNRALIVGVGADLADTITDANGLANILTDRGRCAFPRKNVTLLTGHDATRSSILKALDALAKTPVDATVVVFFSGHGYTVDASTGQSYFLMPFGYDPSRLAKTAISGQVFADKLAAIPARRVLLLLDCCHSGGVADDHKAPGLKAPGLTLTKSPIPPEAQALFAQGQGRIVVASSTAEEVSYVSTPYSWFTRALIECLCGQGVSKTDGFVRAADLGLYARQRVPEWTKNRQHPIFDFSAADNFVVAYYAGGQTQAKGLPEELPEITEALVDESLQRAGGAGSTTYTATQSGSGGLAQGEEAMAGGEGAVLVRGNVTGPINTGNTSNTGRQINIKDGSYFEGSVDVQPGAQFIAGSQTNYGAGGPEDAPGLIASPEGRQVYELLAGYFTLEEITTLCFEMKIDDENLRGQTKAGKARSLVQQCEKTGQLDALRQLMRMQRPNLRDQLQ